MCLFDTIDGCFMNFAYDWAFSKPIRKVFYNLTITGLSVFVAFFIGTIELIGLIGRNSTSTIRSSTSSPTSTSTRPASSSSARSSPPGRSRHYWHFGNVEEKWDAKMIKGEPIEAATSV